MNRDYMVLINQPMDDVTNGPMKSRNFERFSNAFLVFRFSFSF